MPDNDDIRGAPRNQPPGLGLGERLRSARKARALSVAQVAESLRLEEASVVALEDGRFDAMGAPVFVRGHLKRYAQLVGLSPGGGAGRLSRRGSGQRCAALARAPAGAGGHRAHGSLGVLARRGIAAGRV